MAKVRKEWIQRNNERFCDIGPKSKVKLVLELKGETQ